MSISYPWPTLTAAALTTALLLTGCNSDDDDDAAAEPAPETDHATSAPAAEGTDGEPEIEQSDEPEGPFAQAQLQDVAGNEVGTVEFSTAEFSAVDSSTEESGTGESDTQENGGVRVAIEVTELPPGFRAVSIHENGICEVQSANEWGQIGDFFSAGGHLPGDPEPEPDVIEGEEGIEEEIEEAPDQELEEEQPPPQGSGSGTGGFSIITMDQQGEPQIDHPYRAGNLPNILVNADGSGYLEFVTDRLSEDLLLEGDGRAVIVHSEPDHHGNIPPRYAPYGPDTESQVTGDTGSRVACGVVG